MVQDRSTFETLMETAQRAALREAVAYRWERNLINRQCKLPTAKGAVIAQLPRRKWQETWKNAREQQENPTSIRRRRCFQKMNPRIFAIAGQKSRGLSSTSPVERLSRPTDSSLR